MDEKARIKEIFDNWYYKELSITTEKAGIGEYSETAIFNEFLKWRVFFNVLKKNKPDLPNYKILDAGCGNGNTIRKLIEYGAEPSNCFGVDISADAITYAIKHSPTTVNYKQGFIHQIGHESDTFDIVFCLGVLIHILDDDYIRQITDEFHRVMKKDGIVIVSVSDADLQPDWGDLAHTTRNFSVAKKELEGLFPKFDCIEVYKSHNDFYPSEIPFSQVLGYIEQDLLHTAFKTFVFKPR